MENNADGIGPDLASDENITFNELITAVVEDATEELVQSKLCTLSNLICVL